MQMDPNLFTKMAAAAAELVQQRQQTAAVMHRERVKRSEALRAATRKSVSKISTYYALDALRRHGVALSPQTLQALPQMRKQAEAEMEALEDRVIEHDAAQEDLMEQLIDAAAEDPVVAAALIESNTDQEVAPEDVEQAANDVAEVMVKEEVAGGPTKESSSQRHNIREWAAACDPLTQRVVLARATYKASQAISAIQQRQIYAR